MDEYTRVEPLPNKTKPRRGVNKHGFRYGTDSAKIVEIMLEGGLDRQDINEKIEKAIDVETRSGLRKNIPSLVSGLLARLEEKGYEVESSWRLVPPVSEDTEEE